MNTRKRKLDNTTYTNNNNKKLKRCFNPFDRTSIHPESYAIADKLLKYMELSPELIGSNEMAKVTRQMNPKGDKKYLHSVKSLIFQTVVCVTEQHYVSIFLTRLWYVRKHMLFQYKGSLVTNQQKCHFSAVSPHFYLPFGFYSYACAVVSKSRDHRHIDTQTHCAQTINEWRKSKIETQCCFFTQTIRL